MAETPKYTMKLSLSILNQLGLNLYSNVPAVLSEAIANAWDADAHKVEVSIDVGNDLIEVADDGCGMDENDLNNRYLNVGYLKRVEEGSLSPGGRLLMGRKGIGKLSLFSIADEIKVHTVKNGERNGLLMTNQKIQEQIVSNNGVYHPDVVDPKEISIEKGTKIILSKLKKRITAVDPFLRKRLARRFSIIGEEHDFQVIINGKPVTIEDRDYFRSIQFLWTIGEDGRQYSKYCINRKKEAHSDGIINDAYVISGWIGAVEKHGQLSEGNNKITILAHGKLVQEDILEDFKEGGLYSKYLIGEIIADFMDMSDRPDITTTNRQRLIEDDERYIALKKAVLGILKDIQAVWTTWRNEFATEKAMENPAILEWYQSLKGNQVEQAKIIFGKIESLPVDKEADRKELYKYAILAFERLRVSANIEALQKITTANELEFAAVFSDLDSIEAILYHDIASQRVSVIECFVDIVDKNEQEKVIQKYVFDHLWLLHPSWERATENARMEETVNKEFEDIDAGLAPDEKEGRVDIRYRTAAGKHIIIELKRADRVVKVMPLVQQVKKYKDALKKCLDKAGRGSQPIEIICILGQPLQESDDTFVKNQLASVNARVICYEELIQESLRGYAEYLEKKKSIARLRTIIESL